MILQSLVKYYEALAERNEITTPGWCKAGVSYALVISETGELKDIICLKFETVVGKKKNLIPLPMNVPEMVTRSRNKVANFLCDNSGYFLGVDDKVDKNSGIEKFRISKEKHTTILKKIDCVFAKAIIKFFETWEPSKAHEHSVLQHDWDDIVLGGGNLVFELDGVFAHEDNEIKEGWEKLQQNNKNDETGVCLVTGERTEIARLHNSIKKIQGAQASGALLVSFNEPAFESYGKEQSFNAPVSRFAVYAYTTALNYLLAHKMFTKISDTTIVSWADNADPGYQDTWNCAIESTIDNQEIVNGVFDNLAKGKAIQIDTVENNLSLEQQFSILALAPNAARLSVRFFYQDTFENIMLNIKKHYSRMEIVKPSYDTIKYLGVWRMLQETINKKSKNKEPIANMSASVLKAIITNGRYPAALYQGVLGRIRSEQGATNKDKKVEQITRGRAAIIKAYLIRNTNINEEEITVALNENSNNIAYTLGRTFSVLEQIQEAAYEKINTTIKDRYFNAACATPASIFPILLKLKNSHIRKLESGGKSKGMIVNFEKLLGSLQDKIVISENESAYPKRLSLEDQGLFILGYYHQNQRKYEGKKVEEKVNE